MAVARKIPTATKERMLNRGSPHKPCPLVQPLPSFVPKPTSRPARAQPTQEVQAVMSLGGPKGVKPLQVPQPKISKKMPETNSIPPIMLIFSGISSLQCMWVPLLQETTPKTIPLMPVTLPLRQQLREVAMPRIKPPAAAQQRGFVVMSIIGNMPIKYSPNNSICCQIKGKTGNFLEVACRMFGYSFFQIKQEISTINENQAQILSTVPTSDNDIRKQSLTYHSAASYFQRPRASWLKSCR